MNIELGSNEFWDLLASDPARLAAEVCSIDLNDIDVILSRQSSLHAWVNAKLETAHGSQASAEFEVTKARARALLDARKVMDEFTSKPKTVDVLKAEVELNERVMAYERTVLLAGERYGALRAMAKALDDRLQMLIQIASKRRLELKDSNLN